ncbi:hypothetical protein DRQ25_04680 [Candidatus Fermentibacteria bacterium]|nr:MAG: hypothetical protein DRQ25_04680 [Candidatus Fermentibacteria bacterium]
MTEKKDRKRVIYQREEYLGETIDVLLEIPSGFLYSEQTGEKIYQFPSDVIVDAKKAIRKQKNAR